MVPKILWRDAQGNEGSVDLVGPPCTIGRAMESTIRSDDAMVSRNHARVVLAAGGWAVEDLGSSNGCYYQEQRVSRHTLNHGDAVRCGSLWIRYVAPEQGRSSSGIEPIRRIPPGPAPIGAAEGDATVGVGHDPSSHGAPQAAPGLGAPTDNSGDAAFLRRRLEQLKSELRLARGGGPTAKRLEEVEDELARSGEENRKLETLVGQLESQIVSEGGDAKVLRAGEIATTAGEVVTGLNDVLSNLRINVMAAEGEFEQFHSVIPRASYELILEALRTSATDMESARDLLRKLRKLAGV